MEEKKEIITDDEFKMIFSYKRLRELLLINSASYPLIYYFMNYFITNQAYKKRESSSPKEGLGSIKFDNITTHLTRSLFCIKSSLERNETFEKGLDILFFSRDRFIELNTENGEIKSDYLFWPIIHKIKKGHLDCRMALVSTPFKSVPNIDDIRLYSLIQYSTPLVLLRSLLFGTRIYLKWRLDRSQIINYLKDNDGEYLISLFDTFFSLRIFYSLICDYSLQNVLKKTKPKVIMANDDVITLKPRKDMENTKFIIMQSALINKMTERYKGLFISIFPLNGMIADYFLVSGTKFKDMKKDTKDSEEIMVTGQPRYDILYQADKIYDKNKICKQLNLDQNKKLILWITQTHSFPLDENEKNISAVFNAVKSLKNVQLVIKLHPAEDQNAPLYKKDKSFNPIIVDGKSDTYELLYACDLMITKGSTTGMEAIALNKPVIVLNLMGKQSAIDYVEQGVALGVYKAEDLKPTIEKLLRDDSEIAKNRERYIENYLYKIDGKATERVVNVIEEMIKESKRNRNERYV